MSISRHLEREREKSYYKIMFTLVGLFQLELKARGRVLSLHEGSQEGAGWGWGEGRVVQPRPQA